MSYFTNNTKEAIKTLLKGDIIYLADGEDEENEIDMMCLGCFASPKNINTMITHAKGLVCCAMAAEWIDEIGLVPMNKPEGISEDRRGTPFYNSVDLRFSDTGISAYERSECVNTLARENGPPSLEKFISPGHIFTLRAKPGLLDERQGHTEFSVSLAKKLNANSPVAVICEVIKNDGTMLRRKDFDVWANHNFDSKQYLLTIEEWVGHLDY
jgi:3,4-dihydroxy 2-butanone 4-phosphate synthase/GTP cyclohydrolase II